MAFGLVYLCADECSTVRRIAGGPEGELFDPSPTSPLWVPYGVDVYPPGGYRAWARERHPRVDTQGDDEGEP